MASRIFKNHDNLEQDLRITRNRTLQAPQIMKQHLKISSQMVDPKFNELHIRFKSVFSNMKALYHSCEKYKASMRSFFYNSIYVTDLFHKILDDATVDITSSFTPENGASSPPIDLRQRTTEILQDFYNSAGLPNYDKRKIDIARLNKQIFVIAKKVENDLVFFENSIQKPLTVVIQVCAKISRTIACREIANTQLSAINDKICRYQRILQDPTKTLTAKQEIHRVKCDKRMRIARSKYETLNSILKDELESFLCLIYQFMNEWFKNYYYTTFRIAYALHYFGWNSPELKKLGSCSHNANNTDLMTVDISKKFHADHDFVANELETLKIIGFNEFYKQKISTANRIRDEGFF